MGRDKKEIITIIYIHGFASAGGGTKFDILRGIFHEDVILSPDLPLSPLAAMNFLEETIREISTKVVLVGTSLGGFFAYYLAVRHKIPALIINPALNPSVTLREAVGTNINLKTGENFEWVPIYLKELSTLEKFIQSQPKCPEKLRIALGIHDEILPYKIAQEHFRGCRVKLFPADHRFLDQFSDALQDPELRDIF